MWRTFVAFIVQWLNKPSWVATIGIAAGFLLFLTGVIWKKPREKQLGLAAIGLCIFAGVLLFIFG